VLLCNNVPAVFKFLLAQPELGLVDITKAQITLDSVRLNYVHGIWYEVSLFAQQQVHHQQQQLVYFTKPRQNKLCCEETWFPLQQNTLKGCQLSSQHPTANAAHTCMHKVPLIQ
jgi:hypothetical protein